MKKVNWTTVVVFSFVVLLAFMIGTSLFGGWDYHGGGMMGPGMMGWSYSPFGWFGMPFMWLVPVDFIVLTVLGVAWLVRNTGGSTPPVPGHPCPNCGKGTQADWQNCPYCGTKLK
ncbi:MAG: zinc ribbon domain-containing protein [Chloroflexota bacterium]